MKVITVCDNPNHPGLQRLTFSLKKFQYNYEVIVAPFQFGGQMQHIYNWAKSHSGRFLYTDAYDTFALDSFHDIEFKDDEILISAEKGCFPLENLRPLFPNPGHDWKFVNAGQFTTTCQVFVDLYELTHRTGDNDQAWLSLQFLDKAHLKLDYNCAIFQSVAFEHPNDFRFERGRLINRYTDSVPLFIHGNGRTDLTPTELRLAES